jgi:hypothetical protein
LGHIGDGKGKGIMLHNCLAVIPLPGNPHILGLAGQIPWLRSSDNDNGESEADRHLRKMLIPFYDWLSTGDRQLQILATLNAKIRI